MDCNAGVFLPDLHQKKRKQILTGFSADKIEINVEEKFEMIPEIRPETMTDETIAPVVTSPLITIKRLLP